LSSVEQPKIGLRERKKIKTKETIQLHALKLFREQGYHETTIEQIADAAEISPSTFFRYFPTKEALVLEDDYDPLLIQAFQEQPSELTPIQAFRNAVKSGLSLIPDEARAAVRERMELTMSVPELRAATLNQLMNSMQMIAELVAARVGRDPRDFHVITFAGSVIGAIMSVQAYSVNHPEADYALLFDEALAHLEAGLPFR
jgi:AcrR family transcriptional regulator